MLADAVYDKIDMWKKYWGMGIEYFANLRTSKLRKFAGGRVKSNGCPLRAAQIRIAAKRGKRSVEKAHRIWDKVESGMYTLRS